jgi:TM2 domain-containing membrane protein YozV
MGTSGTPLATDAMRQQDAPMSDPVSSETSKSRLKSARLAATLSFVCPGLGQLYCGKLGLGLLMMLLTLVCVVLMAALVGFVLLSSLAAWSIYDAYATAEAINRDALNVSGP